MIRVEFDITASQLIKLGWEAGHLIHDHDSIWLVESVVKDSSTHDTVWVTLQKPSEAK